MIRSLLLGLALFGLSGCFGGKGGPGGLSEDGSAPEGEADCAASDGVLEGSVYYWGLPGDPDSMPADSVDVFLTSGGPTYRTPTSVHGTFEVALAEGEWVVTADNPNGCIEQSSERVTVKACETTSVTLLIDLCEF